MLTDENIAKADADKAAETKINYVCPCESCKIVRANHRVEMDRQHNTAYGSRVDWFRDNEKAWNTLRAHLCRITVS